METIALEELLEYIESIDLLREAIKEEARAGVPALIEAFHKAALESLVDEGAFQDAGYSLAGAEKDFRELLGTAAAIYAIAVNWKERDEGDYNPALSALLDEIGYKGERYLVREYRL